MEESGNILKVGTMMNYCERDFIKDKNTYLRKKKKEMRMNIFKSIIRVVKWSILIRISKLLLNISWRRWWQYQSINKYFKILEEIGMNLKDKVWCSYSLETLPRGFVLRLCLRAIGWYFWCLIWQDMLHTWRFGY